MNCYKHFTMIKPNCILFEKLRRVRNFNDKFVKLKFNDNFSQFCI